MFDKHRNPKQAAVTSSTTDTPEVGTGNATSQPSTRTNAMIGPTVRIQGQITSEEDLLIEGSVEGSVTSNSHEVTVGSSGNLKANIAAKMIKIEGSVEGDIAGHEKVIITRTGKVRGNITAPAVTLEDGAKFKGSIDMDPSPQQTSAIPLTKKPTSAGLSDHPSKGGAAAQSTRS